MAFKSYEHEAVQGIHLPDANKGDNIYYEFPFRQGANIFLMEFSFIFPEEITSSDSYAEGTRVMAKLLTPKVGNFNVTCIATLDIAGRREVDHIVRVLKVY